LQPIKMMDYPGRLKTFRQTLEAERLDGFVVTHPANLRYLCGFTGSNGLLLSLNGRWVFFTDGRYTTQAREEVRNVRVVISKGPLLDAAAKLIGDKKSTTIGFEADHTTVTAAAGLRKLLRKKIIWKPMSGLIIRLRIIKDADELRLIRQAVKVGTTVYQHALPSIRTGVLETAIAGELELAARQAGADGMAFETIVAAGKRSALPHGRASNRPIPSKGFVVVDSGVVLHGYCSDMTRTVHVGPAGRVERQWYEAVLEAQLTGIAAVKAGATAQSIDEATRRVLRRAKLDKFFTHSTGHGVGLEIHEPPRLGNGQEEQLQTGMVITIEPGIYVPGKGGIRIEDMVVVTNNGCQELTCVNKGLLEI
jgi:Xaa-Pro aminopeptidase